MAPLTNGDIILIKILHLEKGYRYSAVQMMREFLARNCSRSTLCDLIKCINTLGNIDRKKGSSFLFFGAVLPSEWMKLETSL